MKERATKQRLNFERKMSWFGYNMSLADIGPQKWCHFESLETLRGGA
jgi:hypothetical protein